MYNSLFGHCCFPRSRACNRYPQQTNQAVINARGCHPQKEAGTHEVNSDKCNKESLIIKNAAFGGVVVPEYTEERATFHVASLNLNTSDCKEFLIQLVFSCNIITTKLKIRLRFQLFKQEKNQCFPVPVSAGILYYRDRECTEANSFTLSACDSDSAASTCCFYSACVDIEDFKSGGSLIIANPTLIATIANRD